MKKVLLRELIKRKENKVFGKKRLVPYSVGISYIDNYKIASTYDNVTSLDLSPEYIKLDFADGTYTLINRDYVLSITSFKK